jgi:sarcosine oxidase subunit beta
MTASITSELPRSADCVIMGGGIIGAATAFYASRAGLRVVLIEKRPALCTLTTPVSTGAFRAQFDNPEEIALVGESIAVFEHFADHVEIKGYDISLKQQGYLWLTTTNEGAARQKELVEMQQGWGLEDVELLNGNEARRRFPYLAPEVVSARFRQADGWLDAKRVTMGFAAGASRRGAVFCVETAATGFVIEGGKIKGVQTSRGTIACDYSVIAAGPFSGVVARMAGLELDFQLRIRQKLILPETPEVPQNAPMTIDEDTGAHWLPNGRGAYLLYTQHDSPIGPPLEEVPTSSGMYFNLLRPASRAAVARLSPFWRQVWERNTDHWFLMGGQYTYTPDHRPYLGPTAIDGLCVNSGYSGHGIMGSAGGSRLAVEAMVRKIEPECNPFRPDRPITRRQLDVL